MSLHPTMFQKWIVKSLKRHGGAAHHLQVAKDIWVLHEPDLRASGDSFYTWQRDLQGAVRVLRRRQLLAPTELTPRGVWALLGPAGRPLGLGESTTTWN